jgi:tryptophan-rich hypothetical protein
MSSKKKRNKLSLKHIVGSKWTRVAPIEGWVHFHVITWMPSRQLIELRSSCNRALQFWVSTSELANKDQWLPGWQ